MRHTELINRAVNKRDRHTKLINRDVNHWDRHTELINMAVNQRDRHFQVNNRPLWPSDQNITCVNMAVLSSSPYAWWINCRSSISGSGAVIVCSLAGGIPTVTYTNTQPLVKLTEPIFSICFLFTRNISTKEQSQVFCDITPYRVIDRYLYWRQMLSPSYSCTLKMGAAAAFQILVPTYWTTDITSCNIILATQISICKTFTN